MATDNDTPAPVPAESGNGAGSGEGAGPKKGSWRAVFDMIDTAASKNETAVKVSKQLSIPPGGLAVVGLVSATLAVFLVLGGTTVAGLYGLLVPAHMSFKALRSPDRSDDTQWLQYWVVFSFLTMLESVMPWTLFWIPYYCIFKAAFLTWLIFYGGAELAYAATVAPTMRAISCQFVPKKSDGQATPSTLDGDAAKSAPAAAAAAAAAAADTNGKPAPTNTFVLRT